jgi:hypothetical protein
MRARKKLWIVPGGMMKASLLQGKIHSAAPFWGLVFQAHGNARGEEVVDGRYADSLFKKSF